METLCLVIENPWPLTAMMATQIRMTILTSMSHKPTFTTDDAIMCRLFPTDNAIVKWSN